MLNGISKKEQGIKNGGGMINLFNKEWTVEEQEEYMDAMFQRVVTVICLLVFIAYSISSCSETHKTKEQIEYAR